MVSILLTLDDIVVTSMLEHLEWNTLKTCSKKIAKILHNEYSLDIPNYYLPQTRHTRQYHPLHFIILNPVTVTYQQSFYARKIREWNHLPTEIIESGNIDIFTNHVHLL